MERFNRDEGIEWRPDTMLPALDRLLREPLLGVLVVAFVDADGGAPPDPSGAADAPIGYGLGTFGFDVEFSGRDAFITELFVDSSRRRSGVGRAILARLVGELASHGALAAHLLVRPENERARRLYESFGFAVVPRLVMTRRLDAVSVPPAAAAAGRFDRS